MMIEIREIGAGELEGWLAVAAAVRPDRAGSVADYVDWKRQAEDMAWFVATVDGAEAGVALAYVGWHSAPGTAAAAPAMGAAATMNAPARPADGQWPARNFTG